MAKKHKKIRWHVRRTKNTVDVAYTNTMRISRTADMIWTAEVWSDGNNRWYYYIDSPNGFVVPDRYGGKTLEQAQARAEAMLVECVNKAIKQMVGWLDG